MKNKGLIVAVVIMAIIILALSVLNVFLIAERSTLTRLEQAYDQGKEDGLAAAPKEKPAETALEDLEPWELYEKGYVWYKENNKRYHVMKCANMSDGNWIIVPEEYALLKEARPCQVCMPGSEN